MTTDEEQRVSELLHRSTPYPPRAVTVDTLQARRFTPRRRLRVAGARPWGPVLSGVAASAAVVGITLGFTALHTGPSAPPASTATPSAVTGQATPVSSGPVSPSRAATPTSVTRTTPTTPSASTASAPAPAPKRLSGPWQPVLIDHQQVNDISIQTDGTDLYAQLFGNRGVTLARIDPMTGAVLAHRTNLKFIRIVVAAPALWTTTVPTGNTIKIIRYDLKTLRPMRSLSYPLPQRANQKDDPVLAADSARHRLYLGAGNTVTVLNANDGQVLSRLTLPGGSITGLAVDPDAATLYAGQHSGTQANGYNYGPVTLASYALASGQLTHTAAAPHSFAAATNLLATAGGVFAMGGSGSGDPQQTDFFPAGDFEHPIPINDGGGGFSPIPTAAGTSIFTGGTNTVTCSNPATGNTRATTVLPHQTAVFYTGIVEVHGQFFTGYLADTATGIARITPPTHCTH